VKKNKIISTIAVLCLLLLFGSAQAAFAAETPQSEEDLAGQETEYENSFGQEETGAGSYVQVNGYIVPKNKPIIPDDTKKPSDPKKPEITKPAEKPSSDKVVTVSKVTQYPDNGTSSLPGETTVEVGAAAGAGTGGSGTDFISEGRVPESAGTVNPLFPLREGAWSIVNAIFTAITVIIAFACAILYISRRKKERDEADILVESRKGLRVFILSFIPAILSITLFIMTQDVSKQMELFDKWSVAFGLVAGASVLNWVIALAGRRSVSKA
jgi:hypothetical protein